MIEGIIFDMDGVLIDSHPVHRDAWRKFLATVGKIVSDKELGFILEGRRRDEILRHFLGDLSAAKIVEYSHQKDLFFQENFFNVKVVPGVREFLDKLESLRLKIAIATSASTARTSGTLRRLKLDGKFSVVVTGDDVDAGKPHPEVYQLTSQRMNLPPDRLLAFEDAPCGIQSAKSAGIRCVGVSTNGRAEVLRRSGAEFVIPNFRNNSLERLLRLSSA
jgi:HAD superfamily hydrolase (TIGR01509 family)